jgi:Flp pilus assembly protein TadD
MTVPRRGRAVRVPLTRPARALVILAATVGSAMALSPAGRQTAPAPPFSPASLEAAYRANNIGVALLEQFRHDDAAASFRKALELSPGLALARANLAIALLNVPKLEEALAEAKAASALLPGLPQPLYVLGLAARGAGATEEAAAAFRAVRDIDPQDVGARVNLGQLLLQERRYPEAIAELRAAVAAEPHNATAVYNLGLALVRSGQAEDGQRTMDRFRALKESGYATLLANSYPEQGRYAEALASTGAEPELVDPSTPAARLVEATERWLAQVPAPPARSPSGSAEPDSAREGRITLFDLDADGDLDLVSVGPEGLRLYANEGGRFADRTRAWGLDPGTAGFGAVAADVDNDTRPDLLVLGVAGPRLFHNEGARLDDVTAAALLASMGPSTAAALADADHDGDLDIVLAGAPAGGRPSAGHRLLQNDGAARFTDVTAQSGLARAPTAGRFVVPTDFDNRRDLDLLIAGSGPPQLFQNGRDGTFREVAAALGLPQTAGTRAVAAGDVNKDEFPDFFFAAEDGSAALALSDGRGRFTRGEAPAGTGGARQAMLLDYDADGLLDLVILTSEGVRIARNLGRGRWADVTAAAAPVLPAVVPEAFAAGDLDGDGHTDLVLRLPDGTVRVLENRGSPHHALAVRLSGLVSNRGGVGAKVTVRAGSLRQRAETSAATPPAAAADLVFGLGARAAADAVRVLWPAGILQTELIDPETAAPRRAAALSVKELDRKPSSCPYLYAWDGRAFSFVTDFLGGGEMGYWIGPGTYNVPDPDEYVRLTDEQLRPRDGRLELRVTNELEEALFVDRLSLLALDHPAEVEVYPDEGLRRQAPRLSLVAVRDARALRGAADGHGADVLDRLARLDRRYVDGFATERLRGYAKEHTLTLDLGPGAGEDAVLLLTGWTDYAFSSDNVAARQAGLELRFPILQAEDAAGAWHTVDDDVGIPVGRPQTLVIEMAGKWRGPSRRVRIVTTMRVYWDQARVARRTVLAGEPVRLEALRADLALRGFSAPVSPDGREPFGYDYTRVSAHAPWKVFPGRYTRLGDVRELLAGVDDAFVVSRPGDEIGLSFDAAALPRLAAGWRRTYLLHADGYSKEMDINSATPHTLGPLPFHGMSRYPYSAPEAYPMTAERARLLERYNTRVVRSPEGPLEAAALRD